MTYHYTDEELNELNYGKNVYSVNKEYVKNPENNKNGRKRLVTPDPKNGNETNIVTADGQKIQVVATKTDQETGFDGMAVAPIVNVLV